MLLVGGEPKAALGFNVVSHAGKPRAVAFKLQAQILRDVGRQPLQQSAYRLCICASDRRLPDEHVLFGHMTRYALGCRHFIRPDAEAFEHVRTERHADSYVRGIATARNEYPADAWCVVARIERVPRAANIRLEPTRKIHR